MNSQLNRYYDIDYRGLKLPEFKEISLYRVLARLVQLFHEGKPRYRLIGLPAGEMAELLIHEMEHDKADAPRLKRILTAWIEKRLLLMREEGPAGPNPLHYKTASILDASEFDDGGTSEMFYRILRSDGVLRRAFHRYFSPHKDENAEEEFLIRLAGRLPVEVDDSEPPDEEGPASICPAFNRLVVDDFRRIFSYASHVSRGTFVRLLENLIGLHLATYEMLVSNIVNNFVKRGIFCPSACPVAEDASDLKGCYCVDGVFTSSDKSYEPLCQVAVRSFVSKIEKYRNFLANMALLRKLEQFNEDGRQYLREPDFVENPTPEQLLRLKEHPDLASWFDAESILMTEDESPGRRGTFGLLDEAEIDPMLRLLSKQLAVLGPARDAAYAKRLERLLGYTDGFGLLSSYRGNFMYYLSDKFIGFTIMLATLEKAPSGRKYVSREISLGEYCNFLRQRYGVNVGGRYKGGHPGQEILRENIAILHRRLFYMGYVLDPLNRPVNPVIRPNIVIER